MTYSIMELQPKNKITVHIIGNKAACSLVLQAHVAVRETVQKEVEQQGALEEVML